MIAFALACGLPMIVGMQTAGEFSRSMERHAMTAGHSPLEVVLVILGVIVVVVTTALAVRCFVRPGEAAADHIKRRILDDDRLESR